MDDDNLDWLSEPVEPVPADPRQRQIVCNGSEKKFPRRMGIHRLDPEWDHDRIRLGSVRRRGTEPHYEPVAAGDFKPHKGRVRIVTAPDGHQTVHLRCPHPRCRRDVRWPIEVAIREAEETFRSDMAELDIGQHRST